MDLSKVKFTPAGYKPTKEEEYSYLSAKELDERDDPKMRYAEVYVSDARSLPIDLTNVKAGDEIALCVKCNVSSKSNSEAEGEPERSSFNLQIIGFTPAEKVGTSDEGVGDDGYANGVTSGDKDFDQMMRGPQSRMNGTMKTHDQG